MPSGFLLDLRHSVRSLRKTPGIVAAVLATLALGVGVNTAMFSVVNAVVLSPLPYPEPDRLVSLWPEKRWAVQMIDEVRDRVTSYDAISGFTTAWYTLLGDGPAEPVQVSFVTASHFEVLGTPAVLGGTFVPGDATNQRGAVVVLSHGFWQRRFGADPGVIGTRIRLSGHGVTDRTIVGVLPPGFSPVTSEVWVPIVSAPGRGSYPGYGLNVIGRLRPGVSPEQARQELRGLVAEFTPRHPTQFRPIRYSPVDVVPMLDNMIKDVKSRLLIALGAVGFILLIACTNVANLMLARAQSRQREIAVQMALGCSGGRIVRQVIAESLLLGALGGVVGAAAAAFALPVITSLVSSQLPRVSTVEMDPSVLAFALGVSLVSGLIVGAVPAARALASRPGQIMRATPGRGQTPGRGSRRINDALVVAQVALCLVLLTGAGLMVKSLWQLARVSPGFDPENVLAMQITLPPVRYDDPAARDALRQRVQERIQSVPGVAAVGSIDYLPLGGGSIGMPYVIEGHERPAATQVVNTRVVVPEYFDVMRIPLVQGRMMNADDRGFGDGPASLLANEAFARQHWPNGGAIGGRVLAENGRPVGAIVGVVRDVRQMGIADKAAPEIYFPATQVGWPTNNTLVVRGLTELPSQAVVIKALHEVEPEIAARNIRGMDEVVHAAMNGTRFYARLLTVFAGVALLLAVVGVYGVVSYAVARRTGELGVRLALGATAWNLLVNVLARAVVPVGIGVAVGLGAALVLTRLLTSVVFEVHVADPVVLGGMALLLTLAAIGAALVPAARATRVSPLRAMQSE